MEQPHRASPKPQTSMEDLWKEWFLLPPQGRSEFFNKLPSDDAENFYARLSSTDQMEILRKVTPEVSKTLVRKMPPQKLAQMLQLATPRERETILLLLERTMKSEVEAHFHFYEDSAMGLLTLSYLRVRPDICVEEAVRYVRIQCRNHPQITRYVYVLDSWNRLVGIVPLSLLLSSDPDQKIEDIMITRLRWVAPNASNEEISQIFTDCKLVALPIVDEGGHMTGIVTVNNVLSMVQREATEDIQKLGGTETLDEPYMKISFIKMIKKRAGWLSALFLGEMLTASAMSNYEDEISKAVVLALFIPLIISSGGNSGSQASTLIVRAIALGEVKLREWWKVLFREFCSGLALGGILGTIGFLRIFLWPKRDAIYGPHSILVAATVGMSLVGIVLWGSLSGAMLPFVLKVLKFDPATASAPFVATLVDVTGLIIYFTCASIFLGGILL